MQNESTSKCLRKEESSVTVHYDRVQVLNGIPGQIQDLAGVTRFYPRGSL